MPNSGAGTGIVERRFEGQEFVIDGRKATISAEIPEKVEGKDTKKALVFTNPSDMLKATGNILPSLSLVRFAKIKHFIDGVYAAIEERVAETGHKLSRDDFLSGLESIVSGDARRYTFRARQGESLGDPAIEVVQGFYDWDINLRQAYRQIKATGMPAGFFFGKEEDNFFNQEIMNSIRRAVVKNPELKKKYEKLLGLYSKTTDRLDDIPVLFPPALLPDQKLFMDLALETQSNIPGGLGKALVQAVKSGRVDYIPRKDSGLYTRQMHEIVPIVLRDTTEFKKFLIDKRYRKVLDDEFISQWAGTRDTHIAHTDFRTMMITASIAHVEPIEITPELDLEPFSTCYDRMAQSLEFFKQVIVSELGYDFLKRKRILPEGRAKRTIGEEFNEMDLLLRGLSMLSKDSIHQPYEDNNGKLARETAEKWLVNLKSDPDLDRNVAIFVPIIREDNGRQIAYINAGYKTLGLRVEYRDKPEVRESGFRNYEFSDRGYSLPVLVHREVRIPYERLINTRELRKRLPERFSEAELDKILSELN